jgi:hypothetical protein
MVDNSLFAKDDPRWQVVTPFYTIQVDSRFSKSHSWRVRTPAVWIEKNAALIREVGPEVWLSKLLTVLTEPL